MIRTLAVLCLLSTSVLAWDVLVRFGITLSFGVTTFISMPLTNTSASESSWVQKTQADGPSAYESLVMWCPVDDFTVCTLYDDTGNISGLQIGLVAASVTNNTFDWTVQGYTSWTTEYSNGTSVTIYVIRQYFVSPDFLATDSATRAAARNTSKLLQNDWMYVNGFNGELQGIPTDPTNIANTTLSNFTEQACIPWMGLHYYYNMTTETECTADQILPWFPLVHDGELMGIGYLMIGSYVTPGGCTDYFEAPTKSAVELIVPDAPDCFYDLAGSPGAVTMHTYFIEHPRQVYC